MSQRQISIIGRGIVGLCIAQVMVERGWDVAVYGPKYIPGAASRAAVGTSTLKGNIAAEHPFFALKIAGHRGLKGWLERLERLSKHPIPRSFEGAYEPFPNVAGYRFVRERVFHRQFTGCKSVAILDHQRLSDRFPQHTKLLDRTLGAFHYFNDLWFHPASCLDALEVFLRSHGVRFCENTVHEIKPHPDSGTLICLANGQKIHSAEIVLAAGIFSDQILANSGFRVPSQEPIEGETVVSGVSQLNPLILKIGKLNAVVQGQELWLGSTSRRQTALSFCAPFEQDVTFLRQQVQNLINSDDVLAVRWGVRGRLKSRMPGIGSLAFPGQQNRRIWVALGFYKNGLQLASLFANNFGRLIDNPTAYPTAYPQPMENLLAH